jgi:hypothetical protein
MEDTRRFCDGVRLHPLLGSILAMGATRIRSIYPGQKISNLEFSRSAIPQLHTRGLIYKIEARVHLPTNLRDDLAKLAKRQNGSPIWFPTDELVDRSERIWLDLSPGFANGAIIWLPSNRRSKPSRSR